MTAIEALTKTLEVYVKVGTGEIDRDTIGIEIDYLAETTDVLLSNVDKHLLLGALNVLQPLLERHLKVIQKRLEHKDDLDNLFPDRNRPPE